MYASRMPLDARYVNVRGPLTSNRQGVVTGARLFTLNDKLYIAESRDRGRTVTQVTSYPIPEGEPKMTGSAGKWGPWVWSSCGCSNQWSKQALATLADMAGTGDG